MLNTTTFNTLLLACLTRDATCIYTVNLTAVLGVRGQVIVIETNSQLLPGDELLGATPLPPTILSFVTGLGAMGLFGWRRKRKNTTAVAA